MQEKEEGGGHTFSSHETYVHMGMNSEILFSSFHGPQCTFSIKGVQALHLQF